MKVATKMKNNNVNQAPILTLFSESYNLIIPILPIELAYCRGKNMPNDKYEMTTTKKMKLK